MIIPGIMASVPLGWGAEPVAPLVYAQRWRIFMTSNAGVNTYLGIQEIEFIGENGQNLKTSITQSTPSSSYQQQGAFKVLDGKYTTPADAWVSSDNLKPQWLAFTWLGLSVALSRIIVYPQYGTEYTGRAPGDMQIQYSDTGTSWTTLTTFTNVTGWSMGIGKEFIIQ